MRCYELSQHNILSLTTECMEKREVCSQESRFKGQPVINYGPLSLTIRNKPRSMTCKEALNFLKVFCRFHFIVQVHYWADGAQRRTHTTKVHMLACLACTKKGQLTEIICIYVCDSWELSSSLFRLVSVPKRDLFYVKTQAFALSCAVAHYIPNKIFSSLFLFVNSPGICRRESFIIKIFSLSRWWAKRWRS